MKRVLHTPEDREEIFELFTAYVEEWKIRLVLHEWGIYFQLESTDFPLGGSLAGVVTDSYPKYHEATMTLHLPDGTAWAQEEIEDTAVHELMHISVSTWRATWERTHRRRMPFQMLNMLLIPEEQFCTRLALGFMRTKYPRRKAHSSSPEGQKQVSPRRRQSPQ